MFPAVGYDVSCVSYRLSIDKSTLAEDVKLKGKQSSSTDKSLLGNREKVVKL